MFDISYQKYLNELKEREDFTGALFVKSAECKTTRVGSLYWDITVSDNSSSMPARLFDATGDENIQPATIAYIVGSTELYQGQMQMRLKRATTVDTNKPEILARVLPTSYMEREVAIKKFNSAKNRITSESIKDLVDTVIERCGGFNMFADVPAAISVHHANLHGLITHTVEVAAIAETMCNIFNANKDIVIAAALLHDIAKLQEYSFSKYNMCDSMTNKGLLLGHLYLGTDIIIECGKELGIEENIYLQIAHCVASHHGKREYGSLVLASTIEAAIVSEADMSSAMLTQYRDVTDTLEPGTTSEPIRTLDGVRIWRPEHSKT